VTVESPEPRILILELGKSHGLVQRSVRVEKGPVEWVLQLRFSRESKELIRLKKEGIENDPESVRVRKGKVVM
jgi:hypothetical protein